MTEIDALLESLVAQAKSASEASRLLAEAKTARQTDRDDYPDHPGPRGYSWIAPEQTLEWKAAATIRRLREALEEVLRTGLNGGNNIRLAFIAAGGKPLTDGLIAKAEESEAAVQQAYAALNPGTQR